MLVLRPPAGLRVRIDDLAFAPDARALAAPAHGKGAVRWTTFAANARGEQVTVPDIAGRVAFLPDGRLLTGNARLFAIDSDGAAAPLGPSGDTWRGLGFAVSPDGSRLVVSSVQNGYETTRLTCYPIGDFANPLWQVDAPAHTYLSPAVGPDGTFVQMESMRHPLNRHWHTHRVRRSLDTGAALDTSSPLPDHAEQFALSPDGATVAIRVREFVHFMPAVGRVGFGAHLRNDSMKHFTGIAFHPSGKYFAATSNDATVKLYDLATLDTVRTFTWDVGRMRSIAFAPDGTLAAAGTDNGKVVVWDVDV